MDDEITIGEFSRQCGLPAKVLRSYADLGLLVPSAVDPRTGYRYYDPRQVDDAIIVALLRGAGVPVADVARFLADPSAEALDGWEGLLAAEVHARREALAEVRDRLGLTSAPAGRATALGVRPVRDRAELRQVFDLLGAELAEPIDSTDFRFRDLEAGFPADRPLMLVAEADGRRTIGGALAFRNDEGSATLRIIAVLPPYRRRGVGRLLVERLESEARELGVTTIALGTGGAVVAFYFLLGYTAHLMFQWVFDAGLCELESELLLRGPLAGLRHWRSSLKGVPQLFVELDEPALDLGNSVREMVSGCDVGFMMNKRLKLTPLAS